MLRAWLQQSLDGELPCIESSQLDGQLSCIESSQLVGLVWEKRFPAAGTYPSGPPEKLTTGSATALATTAFGWRALLDRGLVRASRFTPLPSGERGRSERLPV